ncbi:MAG: S8 family peptidase [Actinobacteria bacterium]|nr:S8 family peptidase [Actinomycetota bacterium]
MMKSPPVRVLMLILLTLVVVFMLPATASPGPNPVRVIVVFDNAEVSAAAMQHIERLGGMKTKDLPMVNGAAVSLPSQAAEHAVAGISGVNYVEPDLVVQALGKPVQTQGKPVQRQPAQVLPWGVDRVNADLVWASYTADPVKVAVVDTGIDTNHPDLAGNLKGGMSAVSYTRSYNDDNGHGSHVAGIIAAVNNSIGVVGVAPAADLYAVKVLDRNGSGYLSDIIEGLQWVVTNHLNVVNMSLGTSSYSSSFDAAVQQTIASGVVVVAAAGNSGPGINTVMYPAKFAGVIAVSATNSDSSNTIAPFSSRGPEVDLAAPGVSVFSTYKNQSYATLSGTSMASPHVAGVAALVLNSPIGADDLNANGVWDPNEVEKRLDDTAQDLGATGFDTNYGYGLVRADLAVVAP